MTSRVKVLIADDNREFCAQCSALFRTYGYETMVAPKDGVKVVEMILEYQPNIVLTDVFMPKLDAIGVMKSVRSANLAVQPLFMMMSTFDNSMLERELLSSGASYYSSSPLTPKCWWNASFRSPALKRPTTPPQRQAPENFSPTWR